MAIKGGRVYSLPICLRPQAEVSAFPLILTEKIHKLFESVTFTEIFTLMGEHSMTFTHWNEETISDKGSPNLKKAKDPNNCLSLTSLMDKYHTYDLVVLA